MNRTRCTACDATNLGSQSECVVCGGALALACRHCGTRIADMRASECVACGGALSVSLQPVGWRVTHTVPAEGMMAWSAPDAASAPSATLPAHLGVQVTREWGAWSQVLCDNGWSGWVDGRLLLRE